ncbi:hypothetical protein Ciccas_000150 [Cichlidogyrus casuarinus]|uniref:UBC core domain-containing protein n=1 Tax=Cichlidogyrus casuarinus TaxID=1844966 RepID=A0ABD2QNX4_9PLAT
MSIQYFQILMSEIQFLHREIANLTNNQVHLLDLDDNNLSEIKFQILPNGGPYRHAKLDFKLKVPFSYPAQAPLLRCESLFLHPNISPEGDVCVSLLNAWSPDYCLADIIKGTLTILYEPCFEDPLKFIPSELPFQELVDCSLSGLRVLGISFPRNEHWCKNTAIAFKTTCPFSDFPQTKYRKLFQEKSSAAAIAAKFYDEEDIDINFHQIIVPTRFVCNVSQSSHEPPLQVAIVIKRANSENMSFRIMERKTSLKTIDLILDITSQSKSQECKVVSMRPQKTLSYSPWPLFLVPGCKIRSHVILDLQSIYSGTKDFQLASPYLCALQTLLRISRKQPRAIFVTFRPNFSICHLKLNSTTRRLDPDWLVDSWHFGKSYRYLLFRLVEVQCDRCLIDPSSYSAAFILLARCFIRFCLFPNTCILTCH